MTTPQTGVTWYQVLGVEPDATPEQIKAAWREATDKFEPGQGSGQFRLFNEAADVLLDPDRRAAYDAELAPEPEPVVLVKEEAPALEEPTPSAPPTHVAADQPQNSTSSRRLGVLVGLLVLALIAVALAVTAFVLRHGNDAVADRDDAGDQATATAERALPAVLSYDYRHLSADRDQAVEFLTKRYATEYTQTFDKLIASSGGQPGPAAQAKAVVKASVQDTGVATASADRVQLVVFLNQTTTKGDEAPTLSLNRLTVSMVKSGNSWLVDRIDSY